MEPILIRIGRTGRLGNPGVATSFFDAKTNTGLAGSLLEVHVIYVSFLLNTLSSVDLIG